MSHWRYQIMQHIDHSGEPFLAIHEFFVGHDKKEGWTASAVPIEADTVADMRMALIDILRDLERHGVRDAKTGVPIEPASSEDR